MLTMICSATIVMKKRKNAGITGKKSMITLTCLYPMAITHLLAYWFGIMMGIISWSISTVLLFIGAYFMKDLPQRQEML